MKSHQLAELKKCTARWYALKSIPEQEALWTAVDDGIRFPVVPAGRRSGKTERAKRFLAKKAQEVPNKMFFAAAPTRDQAKKIWWADLKLLTFSPLHAKPPSETDLIIYLANGSEIHVIGLDRPQRIEGIPWYGGVIDEIADVKPESIDANIMPALDTVNPLEPDYRAWCWFIGVPDGLNHYYKMAQYAQHSNDPDWAYFHWTSDRILPPDVIESAQRRMSKKQYSQEYRASFETAGGRIYEDYSGKNYTDLQLKPSDTIHWAHDFNYTPLSSCISVVRGDTVYFLDEIILESAVSRQAALEFVEKFKDHQNKKVYIYGDPAGRAGEKHGHKSDYNEIEEVLRDHKWKFERRVRPKAPSIKDRHNSVRAKICNAKGDIRLRVNTEQAPWCHQALATVQFKKGSTYQEDDSNQYQHISTAIGYQMDYLWPSGEGRQIMPPMHTKRR